MRLSSAGHLAEVHLTRIPCKLACLCNPRSLWRQRQTMKRVTWFNDDTTVCTTTNPRRRESEWEIIDMVLHAWLPPFSGNVLKLMIWTITFTARRGPIWPEMSMWVLNTYIFNNPLQRNGVEIPWSTSCGKRSNARLTRSRHIRYSDSVNLRLRRDHGPSDNGTVSQLVMFNSSGMRPSSKDTDSTTKIRMTEHEWARHAPWWLFPSLNVKFCTD